MDACLLTRPACRAAPQQQQGREDGHEHGSGWRHLGAASRLGQPARGEPVGTGSQVPAPGAAPGAGAQPLPVHAAAAARPKTMPDLERTGRVQAGAPERAAGWGKVKESPETLPRWGLAGQRRAAHIPSPVQRPQLQLSPGAPREHGTARTLRRSGSRAPSRAGQTRARCWGLGQAAPGAGKNFASPGARAAELIWAELGLGLARGYHRSHEASSSLLGTDLTPAGTGANTDSEMLWLNGAGKCYGVTQTPLGN